MNKTPLTSLCAKKTLIAPSILAADFADLGQNIRRVEDAGADIIHVDVMDGHFVPNISLGPPVISSIRKVSSLPYDVHLMIEDPLRYAESFAQAGADHLTIHVEASSNVSDTLQHIRDLGCSVGISLRPGTQAADLAPYMDQVDLILVMTVEPGFGGQSFRADMLPKIREIRRMITASGRSIHLEVDGGIAADTAPQVVDAGANMLVAGTSVFRAPEGMARAIQNLRDA